MNKHVLIALCAWCVCSSADARDVTKFQVKQPNGVVRYFEPILSPDKGSGENLVFNPTVLTAGDRLAMIYRVNAKGPTESRFKLAFSEDGRNFVPDASNPVMTPDSPFDWNGCEDPRLVRFNRTYYLTYVGNMGGGHDPQCLATSSDFRHWGKKGVILKPEGSNRSQVKAGVIVPEKIGGKYIMYFAGSRRPGNHRLAWLCPMIGALDSAAGSRADECPQGSFRQSRSRA